MPLDQHHADVTAIGFFSQFGSNLRLFDLATATSYYENEVQPPQNLRIEGNSTIRVNNAQELEAGFAQPSLMLRHFRK